jgi:hypothetical protein
MTKVEHHAANSSMQHNLATLLVLPALPFMPPETGKARANHAHGGKLHTSMHTECMQGTALQVDCNLSWSTAHIDSQFSGVRFNSML